MDNQDWTPVVVKKTKPKTEIVAKNTNSEYTLHKKLENDEIHVKAKMFSHESKQTIIQYRLSNKLSQSEMDSRCNFPRNTIQQLEANKRAPTTKELQMLNRVLKTGLTLA
jgi:hypothetical protein